MKELWHKISNKWMWNGYIALTYAIKSAALAEFVTLNDSPSNFTRDISWTKRRFGGKIEWRIGEKRRERRTMRSLVRSFVKRTPPPPAAVSIAVGSDRHTLASLPPSLASVWKVASFFLHLCVSEEHDSSQSRLGSGKAILIKTIVFH